MPHVTGMPLQILIAFDQLCNTLCGGWADETLSSRAWRLRAKSRSWAAARRVIDALFFLQPGHCRAAYRSELARAHLPPVQRGEEAGPVA